MRLGNLWCFIHTCAEHRVKTRWHAVDATRVHQRRRWVVSGPNLGRFGPRKVDSDADALPAAAQASDASDATKATNSDAQSWAASLASRPILASVGMAARMTLATVPTGSNLSSSSSNRVWPSSAVSGCVDWGGFFFGGCCGGGGGGGASILCSAGRGGGRPGQPMLYSGRGVLGTAAAGRRRVGGPAARRPLCLRRLASRFGWPAGPG